MKALLVRLSSIGDVVHTLPALRALRRSGAECGFLVEPAARPLLEGNPEVAWLLGAPPARRFAWREAAATVRAARGLRFDRALDFQGLWKSAAWARACGAGRVVGWRGALRREPGSGLLIGETPARPPEAPHVIDKNLALLRALGIEAVGLREFPLPDTGEEARRVGERLAAQGVGGRFVLLNPGGGWASKLWPPEAFGALARGLAERGHASLVSFGPGEEALAARVAAASAGSARVAFPTTLRELLELLRRARLVVAADTGPLHIACALGTPVVGLYGPTDPRRNGPFSAADRVARRTPACAPCHRRVCPRHQGVMSEIPVEEVLALATARLETPPPR
ncbi:MAG: glycosyltransferase family 9 protein [Vicinamibacteria bacterium]